MTNPDYRAMCAELVAIEDALSGGSVQFSNQGQAIDGYSALATFRYVADKARILLAQQEPEGPTDEDLEDLAEVMNVSGNPVPAMRRALELWGRSTPQPVAVSERLPGPEDGDEQGRCWMFGNIEGDWRLISTINPGIPKLKYCFSHWLPANALPTPEATND